MSSKIAFRPTLWVAMLAFAGLVAGHWLSYLVAAPDPHTREELLRATGHGSHDVVVTIGLAAAVAGLIAVIGSHLRTGGSSRNRSRGLVATALPLWVLQTAGFVALETAERVHGLHDLATLVQEPAFLLGFASQALVALTAALVVLLLRTTVDAIRRLFSLPQQRGEELPLSFVQRPSFALSVARAAWNLRGPPIAAANQG